MKKVFAVVAMSASLFGLASCGGGSSGVSSRGDFADQMIKSAKEEGVAIDEGCVKDAVNDIPDADFELMKNSFDALVDGSTEMSDLGLSEEGVMALFAIFECETGS